jgi:riboflavin kinase/FMN adenylyltransferase
VITLETFDDVPARLRGAYLAVGNFDGVHRGHSRLIGRLRALADEAGAPAVALTFDPHPVALLRPEMAPVPLAWTERNVALLEQAGATEVGVFRTGPWLLGLTAREFFDRVIVGQFAARGVVEGPNFGFGRDRGGDSRLLAQWCAEAGLAFEVAAPTEVDGQIVSSSRIRRALAEGRVDEANALLGRPHRLRGIVTHGAARGAGLGFPTANLDEVDTLIPSDGVYAARAFIDGRGEPRAAAVHIGPNVTFGEQIRKVEAHLIGFSGDLYGRFVELDVLELLRPSRRFEGLDDLLAQIRTDVDRAQAVAAGGRSRR